MNATLPALPLLPLPLVGALAGCGLGLLAAAALLERLSPVVTEALRTAARLAAAAAAVAVAAVAVPALRGAAGTVPAAGIAAAGSATGTLATAATTSTVAHVAGVLVAVGSAAAGAALALGALGALASAEAGWRRPALWGGGIALAAAIPGVSFALLPRIPSAHRLLAAPVPLLAGALAWLLPYLLESRRVKRELEAEAALGILPPGDPPILAAPWRRARERSFGRPDERREYVRCALLLAVARAQQRRRTGEAERIRQLEILSFRTRVRRAVDVRREKDARIAAAVLEASESFEG